MRTHRTFCLALGVLMGPASLGAEEISGLPLHVKKLNPHAIRVWLGDSISSTGTVALSTAKGIVVIDTLGNPALDRQLRKVIARELGRNDFKYLINTHEHGDHTLGNEAYADCTIVAHALCAKGMKANQADNPRMVAWYGTRIQEQDAEIAKAPANAPNLPRMKEERLFNKLSLEALQTGMTLTFPAKTFQDAWSLNMGDTTFEFYYAGGMHSASDILVFVPEQGLLMTGDTMADAWLTDTPGCLASFMVRSGVRHDFPRLLKNWEILLAKKNQIKEFIPGHWNGTLSLKGFENRCHYIKTLWEGIQQTAKEGKPLETIFADFGLRARFPELVNSPGITPQNHGATLLGIWSEITKTESAAARMYQLVGTPGSEKNIQGILADHGQKPGKYFFVEAEFNSYGYRLLQENKADQALVLFKAGVELFPRSWNAFDSLAEAYLKAGDTEKAIANYEKSLERNPANKNGVEMLEKLRARSN